MRYRESAHQRLAALQRRIPEVSIGILVVAALFASLQGAESRVDSDSVIADAITRIPKVLEASDCIWVATREVPIPTGQSEMLQLEAAISREYRQVGTSPMVVATLFVSKVRDARLMTGHHPPICYPASGWNLEGDGDLGGLGVMRDDGIMVRYRIYRFTRAAGPVPELTVVSGFWNEDGMSSASLDSAIETSLGGESGGIGLSQFQILFQEDHSDVDLQRYVTDLLGALPEAVFARQREEVWEDPSQASEVQNAEAR